MKFLNTGYIIGIDEVGRGPLAGEVTVVALAMPRSLKFKNKISKLQFKNKKLALRDSKKLTRISREEWFHYIKKHSQIFYATASVKPATIDRINIRQAANRAATTAYKRLVTNNLQLTTNCKIFLDGGLHLQLDASYKRRATTVIRGDEKIPAVSLASIIAKVTRDRRMRRFHEKYPQYGFLRNVGYGTKEHIKAIQRLGPTPAHRLTFIKKYAKVTNN